MVEGALRCEVQAVPAVRELPRLRRTLDRGLLVRLWRSERGTAVVEFALIAPVLFLLVFGLVDFARALAYYNDLTQLAGQGARAAAVNHNPDGSTPSATSIQSQLAANAAAGELRNGIVVCITHAPSTLPDYVQVKTSYQFNLGPTAGVLKILSINLSATSTMLAEALPQDPSGHPTYAVGNQSGAACS
jgi:Flp pilus assembly protein TadG